MNIKMVVKSTLAPEQENLRYKWIVKKIKAITEGKTIIDVGAGEMPYKVYCDHLNYVSQDFGKYNGKNIKKGIPFDRFDATRVDIISDMPDLLRNFIERIFPRSAIG